MGGNLFQLGRLPAPQYRRLEARLRPVLSELFASGWRIPLSHADKSDFGDLDVLVSADLLTPDALRAFAQRCEVTQKQTQSGIHSHALPLLPEEQQGAQTHFQVDLFATPPELLEVRHQFMSWGDCGNIVARMAKPWGLKWGQDGLFFVHRLPDNDHYQGELLLSREIGDLLALLELNAEQYRAGFASEQEMFEWVMASPQFSPRPYQRALGQLGKKIKTRPGMERFAALVLERYGREVVERQPLRDPAPFFPSVDIAGWVAQENAQQERIAAFKARVNGRVVQTLRPELEGRALGAFMQALRRSEVQGVPFEAWALTTPEGNLHAFIRAFQPEMQP